MTIKLKIINFTNGLLLLIILLMISSVAAFGQRGSAETIDATAFGTSTQMGRNFGVKIIIYEFSSPEDRDILVQAFQKGQNDGLVNALEKMKSVGRITIPGTLGFDLQLHPGDRNANRQNHPFCYEPQDCFRRILLEYPDEEFQSDCR